MIEFLRTHPCLTLSTPQATLSTFVYAFGVIWVVLCTALGLSLLMGRLLDASGAWLRRGWQRWRR